jgi:uncharacterized protein (TIGR03067 family)
MLPVLLSLTLAAPIPETKDDQKALQGTWVVVTAEMDGKEFKPALKATMTFKDDKVTVLTAEGRKTEGTFKLDTAAKPRTLDLIPNDKDRPPGLAVYQLDGDKLKLCMVEKPGGKRPTEFKSGPDVILLELKREK